MISGTRLAGSRRGQYTKKTTNGHALGAFPSFPPLAARCAAFLGISAFLSLLQWWAPLLARVHTKSSKFVARQHARSSKRGANQYKKQVMDMEQKVKSVSAEHRDMSKTVAAAKIEAKQASLGPARVSLLSPMLIHADRAPMRNLLFASCYPFRDPSHISLLSHRIPGVCSVLHNPLSTRDVTIVPRKPLNPQP